MSELAYKSIIYQFLNHKLTVEEFIDLYMQQWKSDRDDISLDPRFRRLIDRVFTSCDCYREAPKTAYEIDEKDLRNEIDLLSYIWWQYPL
ncbi:colicin immunity domain-containing protein [Spirosoma endophyticum]|uniref:Self-protective colicin-like immunity n=1 Tax=Spirosoma endophyticum TaxID=662367 RepID=A0A1I2HP44_9BACT|nr:self-protective colicin-like immunity [Spirosoma endophyticum]